MIKVKEYLRKLEESKEGKPEQIKEAIEIYVGLWKSATEKGIISMNDELEDALEKIEDAGGLYRAAGY